MEPTTVYPQVCLVSRSLLLTSLWPTSLNIPQLPKSQSFKHEPHFPFVLQSQGVSQPKLELCLNIKTMCVSLVKGEGADAAGLECYLSHDFQSSLPPSLTTEPLDRALLSNLISVGSTLSKSEMSVISINDQPPKFLNPISRETPLCHLVPNKGGQ